MERKDKIIINSKYRTDSPYVVRKRPAPKETKEVSRRWFLKAGLAALADQVVLDGSIRKTAWRAATSEAVKGAYREVAEAVSDMILVGVPASENNSSAVCAISSVFRYEVKQWYDEICDWSLQYGMDPNITAIIMQIESCGDPQAVSVAGAQGLFQVMPFHFEPGENMQDPDTNARRGLNYFVERLHQTNGEVGKAFAGYNGGHRAAASSWDSWPHETQRYYVWSTGIYNDIQAGRDVSPTLQEWLQAGGQSLCDQASQRLGLQ